VIFRLRLFERSHPLSHGPRGVSQRMLHRSLPLLFGVLLVAGLAGFFGLVYVTDALDRNVTAHGGLLVRKALEQAQQGVAREANLYATLERNALPGDDPFPYETQDGLYRELSSEMLGVQRSANRPIRWLRNQTTPPEVLAGFANSLARMNERARVEQNVPVAGLLIADPPTALAVAAAISVPQASGGDPLSLLQVDILSEDQLSTIGLEYGLLNLHLDSHQAESGESGVVLETASGAPAYLNWTSPNFGHEMVSELMPGTVGAALLLVLLVGLIAYDAVKSARALETGFEALSISQADLGASETRFRDIAEAASDWLWETDALLRLTYLSERFEQIAGVPVAVWLGRPMGELLRSEQHSLADWLESSRQTMLRCSYVDHSGQQRICKVAVRPVMVDGMRVGYRGTASDITEEVRAREEIEHRSMHDPLTDLPNRNRLNRHLQTNLAAHRPLAMLSLDLDRFKPVNDTLGHAAGDSVLQEVSVRLKQCCRAEDLVARLGGDEFVMVVDNLLDQPQLEQLCARIVDQLKQPFVYQDQKIFIGTSVGIALAPHDANDSAELLRCADVALYQAKADGRGNWRFYAEEMNQRLVERRQLEQGLRVAIEQGQLHLHYQPRYRTDGLKLIGAEALARWEHPTRGMLAPDQFIPLAEETGLIVELGRWVLQEACREAAAWPAPLIVSVNLSTVQFQRSQLVNDVTLALRLSGLPAERLELEVTESVLLDDVSDTPSTLQALKQLGVRIVLDDFGTGYSSLSYLHSYLFDGLKIDRSFIANLDQSEDGRSIVRAILGLANSLNITVTAEGVETRQQLELLAGEHCEEVQGFHLSRPQPPAHFRQFLTSANF
jgi:diguanylate cyclase (GGDEF)-like protein/PAS domain S-box-containing protein